VYFPVSLDPPKHLWEDTIAFFNTTGSSQPPDQQHQSIVGREKSRDYSQLHFM